MICWSSYDDVTKFLRWLSYEKVTICVRSQHLTLSGDSPNYYAFPFAIGNLLPDWSNYYEGMKQSSIGGFKWPWDLVIWWFCWSQSVETPLVLKYIPTRPSLCRVWIRAVAGLEEQSFVRNCSSVGRTGRGQPSSSRCSNCDWNLLHLKVFGDTHACLSTSYRGGCSLWRMASCSKRPSVRSWPTFLRLAPLFVHFKPEKGWFRNPILHASF